MLVEIDDRTYSDFMEWSSANGMSSEEALRYINRAFRDRFMTDKYGDLTEKFAKPEPKQDIKPEKNPEPATVVQQQPNPEEEPDDDEQYEEPIQEVKPKPKRKVLKSK